MSDDFETVVKHAGAAVAMGATGRVIIALNGGERAWVMLGIQAALGSLLGFIVGSAISFWVPNLRDAGWGLYFVMGAAGWAGAVGTRLIDIVVDYVRLRLRLANLPKGE